MENPPVSSEGSSSKGGTPVALSGRSLGEGHGRSACAGSASEVANPNNCLQRALNNVRKPTQAVGRSSEAVFNGQHDNHGEGSRGQCLSDRIELKTLAYGLTHRCNVSCRKARQFLLNITEMSWISRQAASTLVVILARRRND